MKKKRFNVTYIAMFIGIFPLTVFITSFMNFRINLVTNIINEISQSINDFPITNFNYSFNCKENEYSHSLYTFPGSTSGCSCVGIKDYPYEQEHKEEVIQEACNLNQTRNKCKPIQSFDKINLFNWKNGVFCSKYYNQTEIGSGYLSLLNNSVYQNEECKEGYKKCGKLDDNGNYLCIPNEEECPINDIIISETELPELIEEKYKYIYLNDTYVYFTNEKKDNSVIVKLKVSENKVCLYKLYHHTDYPQYILTNDLDKFECKFKINGKLYDESIKSIDNRIKYDFYEDSDLGIDTKIYNSYIYDFPYHSLQEEMILYPKHYIGFDKKCLMENGGLDLKSFAYNENEIKKRNDNVQKMKDINTYIIWFSFFSFIIEIYACSIFDLDSSEACASIFFWTLINCICYGGMSPPIYINLNNLKNYKIFPLCGDYSLNEKISNFNRVPKAFKTITIIQIISINLQILFNIIIIIIINFFQYSDPDSLLYKYKNYSKNIDYNKYSDNYEDKNSNSPPEKPYYD